MFAILLALSSASAQSEAPAPTEPAPAPAEPANDAFAEAKKLYENGVRLYDEALYEQAITAFQASYELSKQHALLFNIANAQERMGDLKAAIATLNTYRVYADAEEQARLDRRVRTLEQRLDEQKAATPAPAPVPSPVPVAPAPATRPNPGKWIAVGGGVGASVVFGTLSGVAYANGRGAIGRGDEAAYGGARALNNLSLGLFAAGLGVTTIGLVLPAERPVAVTASVGPRAARVSATVRF